MVSQNVSPTKQLFKPGACFVFMKRVEEKSCILQTLPAFSIFEQAEKGKLFSGIIFAYLFFMQRQLEDKLIDKIAIVTEQLIELAWEGNDVATEERSRLFFGGVLDDAFKVRKNTKLELRRRGRAPIDDIE